MSLRRQTRRLQLRETGISDLQSARRAYFGGSRMAPATPEMSLGTLPGPGRASVRRRTSTLLGAEALPPARRRSSLSRADRDIVDQAAAAALPPEEYVPQEMPALLRDKYARRGG